MTYPFRTTVSSAALALTLAGCASAPEPSPRLLAAEASLQRAKANPGTMESGQAAIEQADMAIEKAREHYLRRRTDDFVHSVRLGEGYVTLAETRGRQNDANARIQALTTERAEAVSEARKREVKSARAATIVAQGRADRSDRMAEDARSASIASEAGRREAEGRSAILSSELAAFEQKRTELGLTLIVRDLQFASDSSVLTPGARGRLAPLATFLSGNSGTRIQITGHTDSSGSDGYNQNLSAQRAASVGAYLISAGTSAARVETLGLGEGVPLSSNATAAGRAINRRVEITLLDRANE